jgi:hypothetical protein
MTAPRAGGKMTIEERILKVADALAANSQRQVEKLKKRMAHLDAELDKTEDELQAELEKPNRRGSFQPRENGAIQCPWCWILYGKRGSMIPVANTDDLRCGICKGIL